MFDIVCLISASNQSKLSTQLSMQIPQPYFVEAYIVKGCLITEYSLPFAITMQVVVFSS